MIQCFGEWAVTELCMPQYALTGSMCAVPAHSPIRHQASFDIWICLDKFLNVLCNVTPAELLCRIHS